MLHNFLAEFHKGNTNKFECFSPLVRNSYNKNINEKQSHAEIGDAFLKCTKWISLNSKTCKNYECQCLVEILLPLFYCLNILFLLVRTCFLVHKYFPKEYLLNLECNKRSILNVNRVKQKQLISLWVNSLFVFNLTWLFIRCDGS